MENFSNKISNKKILSKEVPNRAWRNSKGPTCLCGAYPFPHRLGGGKCDALVFVEKLYKLGGEGECKTCELNNGFECEIVIGVEKTNYCPALWYWRESYGVKESPFAKYSSKDYFNDEITREIGEIEYKLEQLKITADTNVSTYQDLVEDLVALKDMLNTNDDNVPF